jgi:hypothetical protein
LRVKDKPNLVRCEAFSAASIDRCKQVKPGLESGAQVNCQDTETPDYGFPNVACPLRTQNAYHAFLGAEGIAYRASAGDADDRDVEATPFDTPERGVHQTGRYVRRRLPAGVKKIRQPNVSVSMCQSVRVNCKPSGCADRNCLAPLKNWLGRDGVCAGPPTSARVRGHWRIRKWGKIRET